MKLCPQCRREYPEGLNFCFDDGNRLEPQEPGAQVLVCPSCLVRFGAGASECARDGVRLVEAEELDRARERICSECGAPASDPNAEFCGQDGAPIAARWEAGLVSRTAVQARVPLKSVDPEDTFREGIASASGTVPKAPEQPTLRAPLPQRVSLPAVAPAAEARPPPAPAAAPAGAGEGVALSSSGVSSSWFAAAAPGSGALEDSIPAVPTRVSRGLLAVAGGSAALFVGALAFFLYARSAASRASEPDVAPPPPPAVAVSPPSAPSPSPSAPAISPPAPATAAPAAAATPAPAPKAPEPALAAPAKGDDRKSAQEVRKPAKPRRPRARARRAEPEPDPARALEEALRKAASGAPPPTAAAPAPPAAPAPTPPPPAPRAEPAPAPAPAQPMGRLSRSDATRYFREASAEYRADRPEEALRRFRIIERTGPPDPDLQGRVLLNMAHIYHRLRQCESARRYYERAQKLIPASSGLRAKVEAGLLQTEECK